MIEDPCLGPIHPPIRDKEEFRMRFRAASAVAILGFIAASSAARAADDVPVGVFQGSTYDGWAVEGDAFRDGPVSGELLTRLEIENAPHGP